MSIVSNFIKIASTGLFVQLISFLFYPLIGRIYSPSEFGSFSFFTSCVLISSVFVTGQFYYAVTNPKNDEEANHLLSLSVWSVFIFSCICLIIITILKLFKSFDSNWLLFPFYLFFYSLFECFKLATVRTKEYNYLNTSQILNRVGSNILKVVKPISNGSLWLNISEIICFFISDFYLFKKAKITIVPLKKLNMSLVRKYKDFPLLHSTSLLIQFLLSELPAFYFKSRGQVDLLGYYSMGNRLFIQPCMLIGYSLHPILIHRFNDCLNLNTVLKVFGILAFFSITAFLVCYFLHLDILKVLIGERWLVGTDLYQIQIWMILSKFFMGTVLALMISQNKSRYLLAIRTVELIFLVIFVKYLGFDFMKTFVVSEISAELLLVGISIRLASKKKNEEELRVSPHF